MISNPNINFYQYTVQSEQEKVFTFQVPVGSTDELVVLLNTDGIVRKLSKTEYGIELDDDKNGGKVEILSVTTGDIVTIFRDIDIKTIGDFEAGGSFRAMTVNDKLDYLVRVAQDLNLQVNKSLKSNPGYGQSFANQLPLLEKDKVLMVAQDDAGRFSVKLSKHTIDQIEGFTKQAGEHAGDAAGHSSAASGHSTDAGSKADDAREWAEKAKTSEKNAAQSATDAKTAETKSETIQTDLNTKWQDVKDSKLIKADVETAKEDAVKAKDAAVTAKEDAVKAKDAAETAKTSTEKISSHMLYNTVQHMGPNNDSQNKKFPVDPSWSGHLVAVDGSGTYNMIVELPRIEDITEKHFRVSFIRTDKRTPQSKLIDVEPHPDDLGMDSLDTKIQTQGENYTFVMDKRTAPQKHRWLVLKGRKGNQGKGFKSDDDVKKLASEEVDAQLKDNTSTIYKDVEKVIADHSTHTRTEAEVQSLADASVLAKLRDTNSEIYSESGEVAEQRISGEITKRTGVFRGQLDLATRETADTDLSDANSVMYKDVQKIVTDHPTHSRTDAEVKALAKTEIEAQMDDQNSKITTGIELYGARGTEKEVNSGGGPLYDAITGASENRVVADLKVKDSNISKGVIDRVTDDIKDSTTKAYTEFDTFVKAQQRPPTEAEVKNAYRLVANEIQYKWANFYPDDAKRLSDNFINLYNNKSLRGPRGFNTTERYFYDNLDGNAYNNATQNYDGPAMDQAKSKGVRYNKNGYVISGAKTDTEVELVSEPFTNLNNPEGAYLWIRAYAEFYQSDHSYYISTDDGVTWDPLKMTSIIYDIHGSDAHYGYAKFSKTQINASVRYKIVWKTQSSNDRTYIASIGFVAINNFAAGENEFNTILTTGYEPKFSTWVNGSSPEIANELFSRMYNDTIKGDYHKGELFLFSKGLHQYKGLDRTKSKNIMSDAGGVMANNISLSSEIITEPIDCIFPHGAYYWMVADLLDNLSDPAITLYFSSDDGVNWQEFTDAPIVSSLGNNRYIYRGLAVYRTTEKSAKVRLKILRSANRANNTHLFSLGIVAIQNFSDQTLPRVHKVSPDERAQPPGYNWIQNGNFMSGDWNPNNSLPTAWKPYYQINFGDTKIFKDVNDFKVGERAAAFYTKTNKTSTNRNNYYVYQDITQRIGEHNIGGKTFTMGAWVKLDGASGQGITFDMALTETGSPRRSNRAEFVPNMTLPGGVDLVPNLWYWLTHTVTARPNDTDLEVRISFPYVSGRVLVDGVTVVEGGTVTDWSPNFSDTTPSNRNYIKNGGFESLDSLGNPIDWQSTGGQIQIATISPRVSDIRTGRNSVQLSNTPDSEFFQPIQSVWETPSTTGTGVDAHDVYKEIIGGYATLGFRYKADSNVDLQYGLRFTHKNGTKSTNLYDITHHPDDWIWLEQTMDIRGKRDDIEAVEMIFITKSSSPGSTILIDDVALTSGTKLDLAHTLQPPPQPGLHQSWFPPGAIIPFAGKVPPKSDWLLCNGADYPPTGIYAQLFQSIAYDYGRLSNGNFMVPHLENTFLAGSAEHTPISTSQEVQLVPGGNKPWEETSWTEPKYGTGNRTANMNVTRLLTPFSFQIPGTSTPLTELRTILFDGDTTGLAVTGNFTLKLVLDEEVFISDIRTYTTGTLSISNKISILGTGTDGGSRLIRSFKNFSMTQASPQDLSLRRKDSIFYKEYSIEFEDVFQLTELDFKCITKNDYDNKIDQSVHSAHNIAYMNYIIKL